MLECNIQIKAWEVLEEPKQTLQTEQLWLFPYTCILASFFRSAPAAPSPLTQAKKQAFDSAL